MDKNTLVIFTSDNGPVLDDGYEDGAVTQLNGHNQLGVLRGGKGSAFEGGTRVPFLVRWPGKVKPNSVSNALVCQIDLIASFAGFFGQKLQAEDGVDSQDLFNTFLGKSPAGRQVLIQQGGAFSLVKDNWKYIEPSQGQKVAKLTGVETGNDTEVQLYDLKNDIGEKNNLAASHPQIVTELSALLAKIRQDGRSRMVGK